MLSLGNDRGQRIKCLLPRVCLDGKGPGLLGKLFDKMRNLLGCGKMRFDFTDFRARLDPLAPESEEIKVASFF